MDSLHCISNYLIIHLEGGKQNANTLILSSISATVCMKVGPKIKFSQTKVAAQYFH